MSLFRCRMILRYSARDWTEHEYKIIRPYVHTTQTDLGYCWHREPIRNMSQQKLGRSPARVYVSAVGWAACRVVNRPNRLVTQFVVASASSNQLSSSYRCVLKHSQFIIYPLFMFILDFSIIHFSFSNFWLFLISRWAPHGLIRMAANFEICLDGMYVLDFEPHIQVSWRLHGRPEKALSWWLRKKDCYLSSVEKRQKAVLAL